MPGQRLDDQAKAGLAVGLREPGSGFSARPGRPTPGAPAPETRVTVAGLSSSLSYLSLLISEMDRVLNETFLPPPCPVPVSMTIIRQDALDIKG